MLTTLTILFAVLWVVGVATSHTLGGFIHILLVASVTLVLLRVFLDRSPSTR